MVTPEDDSVIPPVPAVNESDTDLRTRTPEAFESTWPGQQLHMSFGAVRLTGAWPDISAVSPAPACVTISVLSREGAERPAMICFPWSLLLNDEEVRPVADRVTVQSAEIVTYQIDATLCSPVEAEPVRRHRNSSYRRILLRRIA